MKEKIGIGRGPLLNEAEPYDFFDGRKKSFTSCLLLILLLYYNTTIS